MALMQFNEYHKYTVDEHTLLAVAKAEALDRGAWCHQESLPGDQAGRTFCTWRYSCMIWGRGGKKITAKWARVIAEEMAVRLGYDEQETRTLVFLVHRHLLMADTAFQRDPYDEKVLLPFARAVATPETLRKLLVLTAADIAAVGPGVLTKWKESLLIELYLRTLPEVLGERDETPGPERLKQLASEVAHEVHERRRPGARLDRIATGPVSLALSAWDASEADRSSSGGGQAAAGRRGAGRGKL